MACKNISHKPRLFFSFTFGTQAHVKKQRELLASKGSTLAVSWSCKLPYLKCRHQLSVF